MNTLEQPSHEHVPEPGVLPVEGVTPDMTEDMDLTPPKIGGYDSGTRSALKEPSLYLSIAVIVIANAVCNGKTPFVFWLSLVAMISVAIAFHVVAERFLFKSKKEYQFFAVPFEGVFVLTFGSILPGLGLLAYSVASICNSHQPNVVEVLGKMALLLVVPLFNFVVWSGVRRGYLSRPRYIGLMNGLALGLSASWTVIWIKTILFHDTSCKLGWMLLLCTSPFLLFAAACLSVDLWQKTEPNIRRITTTFSILGCLLSVLFVFTPMVRGFVLQTQLTDARKLTGAPQESAISFLRSFATDEDLRPAKYPVSGFALAELLLPNRGLDTGTEFDRDLYFKITGKSYFDVDSSKSAAIESDSNAVSPVVGSKVPGLFLTKSHLSGNIDAATFSSSVDWMFTFHNSSMDAQEVRGEINVPKNAVLSRATLWVDGEPRESAFASTRKVQLVNQADINRAKDPLLVTMSGPDRVFFRLFSLPAHGGEMKIRLGFKVPLETSDGRICAMELPKLLSTNFYPPKRHRVEFTTPDLPIKNDSRLASVKNGQGYALSGIIKSVDWNKNKSALTVLRATNVKEIATLDSISKQPRFIIEKLRELVAPAPKRLVVVVDTSASLKPEFAQIKAALAVIPTRLKSIVYLAGEHKEEKETDVDKQLAIGATPATEKEKEKEKEIPLLAIPLAEAQAKLNSELFVGGQNNGVTLREAIEVAAEQPHSAVLWIHGPQPQTLNTSDATALDLVHNVSLYDMQIVPGLNTIPPALKLEDVSNLITSRIINHESTVGDLKKLVSGWEKGVRSLAVVRTVSAQLPDLPIVADKTVSAQMTALWARQEVSKLMESGHEPQAIKLASTYHLVSPVTGAVVLENAAASKYVDLRPGTFNDAPSGGGGLVGAPVDPRYGQSNEVGQLADFGYDTARDIARMLVLISAVLSMLVAGAYMKGQKSITQSVIVKAVLLVIAAPTVIHLMSTFVINNFGGLGGGL
ncbi:MAG: hypothetical protein IAF58_09935 [Leptolyngbya sp.]|nr:hypothetical protein [Candidatus Melainabacteria bacterium]